MKFRDEYYSLMQSLYRYALGILSDEELAKDVVQETYIKVFKRAKIKKIVNLKAYCIRTVRNMCLDQIKSHRHTVEFSDNMQIQSDFDLANNYENKDQVELVKSLLKILPEKQRTILLLKDIEGYSYKELTEVLNMDENNLRVTLSIARKKIRNAFNKLKAD